MLNSGLNPVELIFLVIDLVEPAVSCGGTAGFCRSFDAFFALWVVSKQVYFLPDRGQVAVSEGEDEIPAVFTANLENGGIGIKPVAGDADRQTWEKGFSDTTKHPKALPRSDPKMGDGGCG